MEKPDRFEFCAADAVRLLLSVPRGSWLSWRHVEITALLSSVGPEGRYARGCLLAGAGAGAGPWWHLPCERQLYLSIASACCF